MAPIKVLTATIDTCECKPGRIIIIWSLKQGSLEGNPLSLCHCYNKIETEVCPLGFSWWQVSPSDFVAVHNALSQSQNPEGTMVLLSPEKLGCVETAFTPETAI